MADKIRIQDRRLDGVWSIGELERRAEGIYTKPDPNFRNWMMNLTRTERRYVLGYLIETATDDRKGAKARCKS